MAKSILSTSILPRQLITDAAANGVLIDAVSFTAISYCVAGAVIEEEIIALCSTRTAAIFTSANAVKAIAHILQKHRPVWDIYCTQNATKDELLQYLDVAAVKGEGTDAAAIARLIIAHGYKEAIFFCGDSRMETLPALLRNNSVKLQEVTVYESEETPVAMSAVYDAVLFYSPGGVRSFFSMNTIGTGTLLFAIGNTTATAIAAYTDSVIYTCATPSKERMVADAVSRLNLT